MSLLHILSYVNKNGINWEENLHKNWFKHMQEMGLSKTKIEPYWKKEMQLWQRMHMYIFQKDCHDKTWMQTRYRIL